MKWIILKKGRWDWGLNGVQGSKNNNKFKIQEHTNGFERKHVGWYIMVNNEKLGKIFNSLWKQIYFEDIEDAKEWCDDFKWKNVGM